MFVLVWNNNENAKTFDLHSKAKSYAILNKIQDYKIHAVETKEKV